MKKILIVYFAFLTSSAFAGYIQYTADVPDACGVLDNFYALITPISYTCDAGEFLPADAIACATCPVGYTCAGGTYAFNETMSQGLVKDANLMTQSQINVCAANFPHVIRAVFTPIFYTCDAGEFLPADAVACVACPSGYTCSGGTYTYKKTESQGLVKDATPQNQNELNACAANRSHIMNAVFTINQYTCGNGYYLPAGNDWLTDNDGCVICPADSYCVGGTYTFNETTPQGIVSCSPGLYAPTGMWESAQCGRILHVGEEVVYLRSTKKTSPALHVDIDNDGVADFFGNATTADVPMTRGTSRKLKVSFGGQTYSIYDDSVDIGEP